ncbi:uncharacterized protein LOC116842453 [Odontomachus brunneus]|uniref:uncharacterized protein LOC116842453 n=1 Tax=Odontomachus brunneus TaxID=486640 RepID=UPI0013F2331B|nr:uncharacterized protein LOC116842453 [Odontomachus brunneus]
MQLLSLNIFLCTLGGIWRPVKWSSCYAKLLYHAFSFYIIVSQYFFVLTQLINLVIVFGDMDEFLFNFLSCLTLIVVCFKSTITLIRQDTIIDLMQTLSQEPCKPRDAAEMAIQTKFDEFIRSCTIKYGLMATGSITSVTIKSVVEIMKGFLPYKAWMPYDLSSFAPFMITSIQQMVTLVLATVINIGTETLICGMILQTCAQIEIFEERLKKLINNRRVRSINQQNSGNREWSSTAPTNHQEEIISAHIRHHLIIYEYAKTVNKVFRHVLFVQFFISLIILCMSVYYLSYYITDVEATSMVVYTICMFIQIYIFCWAGNEVILKSSSIGNAVYQTDWCMLPTSEKKDLLMIMKRSAFPIKFTSSFLIILSLESFSGILKTSYSAFSVLQQKKYGKKYFEEKHAIDIHGGTSVRHVYAVHPRLFFHSAIRDMRLLSLNFFICTLGGIWRPVEWSSSCAHLLYNAFTFCTIVPLYFLVLTQFMDLVLVVDNMDDFTTNSLMFLTIVAACCKATIALIRRDAIIDLVHTLLREPCKPRGAEETAIQTKFDDFIRSWSIRYSLLATSSATGVTIKSVLNVMQGILPHRAWVPYDVNLSLPFWITSILQIISLIFTTIIDVGTETVIFGLFLQTCAQLEIFERRLYKLVINKTAARLSGAHERCFLPNYKEELISSYIHHHLSIYQYAKTVNRVFNQILFVQFFVSILVLCTSVYYLSSHIMETEAATMIIYTFGMFVQIFVYCWSGNEVLLKSLSTGDAVYHMDWPLLSINEKRDLLMIMKRSTIPIKFTSSFLVTLSLQSYGNVNLIFVIDDMDDFIMNSLICTTIFAVCCKATITIIRRDAIIDLVQILSRKPCKPQDADEMAIQAKFDKFIRLCTLTYAIIAASSFTTVHTRGILNMMKGNLPHRAWVPYDLSVFLPFLITGIQEIVTMFFATIINVAAETLIFGMFLQTCAQIEIFERRLHKSVINKTDRLIDKHSECFPDTSTSHNVEIMSEHIRHHLIIYKYAKMLNNVLNPILFVQFFISIYILCMIVYYLSSHIKEFESIFMVMYATSMFLQIFIYCWSGNEVICKSARIGDAVYQTNWSMLSISDKKCLLMIMKRSTIPIKFTSSFLITLSLEAYTGILKTSYSAFNVLQQRS